MANNKATFFYTNFDSDGNQQHTSHLSSSSSSNSPAPSTTNVATTSSGNTSSAPNPTNSILRRAHTKSRRGCLNCKRRRIKCPENHPTCTQCAKRNLTCSWPDIAIQLQSARSNGQVGNSSSSSSGSGGLDMARYIGRPEAFGMVEAKPNKQFSMLDFRLFNHFIRDAHPFHPMMNEERWTHDVPAISHNYDFLLHAMLGLAASELASAAESQSPAAASTYSSVAGTYASPTEAPSLRRLALHHRLSSIRSLHLALGSTSQPTSFSSTKPDTAPAFTFTPESGNAMLATCYILVFQSALISDGFPDFMAFIRGCMVVAYQMGVKGYPFIFRNMLADKQLEVLGPHLETPPGCDEVLLKQAIDSLFAMEPLVKGGCSNNGSVPQNLEGMGGIWEGEVVPEDSGGGWEYQFWGTLMSIVLAARESSRDAYLGIMKIYGLFAYHLTVQQFQSLIDPLNIIGQLLQAHLVAIQTILDPVLEGEHIVTDEDKSKTQPRDASGQPKASSPAFQSPRHKGSWEWLSAIHARMRGREDRGEVERYFAWTLKREEELAEKVRLEVGFQGLTMSERSAAFHEQRDGESVMRMVT